MRRTNVLRLLPTRDQEKVLLELADREAALWNAANYLCRQAFFQHRPVPGYARLCRELAERPAYRALPSDMAQETLKKLAGAWRAFFALRRVQAQGKAEQVPKPPRYRKDRSGRRIPRGVSVKAPRSYSVSPKALALALPSDLRGAPRHRLVLRTRGVLRYAGELKTCEIRYDRLRRRWYAHATVEAPDPAGTPTRTERWAGIDTGARVLAAVAVEGDYVARLYRSREVWREFLYWTRRIAEEQSRLAGLGLRTSRRLRMLYSRRAMRLRHAFQALAAEVARTLHRAGVTHVAIEDLTGIRARMDFGPRNLLVHNFWAFAMWRRFLESALVRARIDVVLVSKEDTSLYCAVCGSPVVRFRRHKARCHGCRRTWHADANAAWVVLEAGKTFVHQAPSKGDGVEAETLAPPRAYRWTRHRWVVAGAESAAAMPSDASRDSTAA